MFEDMALEKNRRYAWARFYATRAELEDTEARLVNAELRRAELAVYIEVLGPPAGHPVWQEIAAAYEAVTPDDLALVRRYVRYRIEKGLPSAMVLEAASA